MDIDTKDLPQLIVGLDSLCDSANYIHIDDVKPHANYYCPCCRGQIKPRAYKKDMDYQVQPHFYHETGGCDEETYIHYICKNWLFEKGCKFIIKNVEYEVDSIDIEKTLHTSFGNYKPDIVVYTSIGKVFYFEIKTTSKKMALYAPKWDELGNDVVEVDARDFVNQKYRNIIPEFKLIYSNGECFIKSYTRTDYDNTIAKRKIEWKRQDKLNYKIQWERLDWFWVKLQKYINGETIDEDVLESFNKLDYSDKLWCYYTIKKKSCIDLKGLFKDCINKHFYDMINSLKDDKISVILKQTSPRIYEVRYRAEFLYGDYTLFEDGVTKVKIEKGDILSLKYEEDIRNGLSMLRERIKQCENILKQITRIAALPYVKSITPYSHWASEKYSFIELYFDIEFEDNIHNRNVKEAIGKSSIVSTQLSEQLVSDRYEEHKRNALSGLDEEITETALLNDHLYQNIISELMDICKQTDFLSIRVSGDCKRITMLNKCTPVYEYEYSKTEKFGEFEANVKEVFMRHIKKQIEQYKNIAQYIKTVNSCKNNMWKIRFFDGNSVIIYLMEPYTNDTLGTKCVSLCNSDDIAKDLYDTMKDLLEYAENYKGIRFLEMR